jgi:hypothetical protein
MWTNIWLLELYSKSTSEKLYLSPATTKFYLNIENESAVCTLYRNEYRNLKLDGANMGMVLGRSEED